jgi:DNA-binding transcriptional LysR family regulator
MQIESLKVFCDLAETESFTKAAQINGVTQSAVSQQISSLERQFKSLLIERSKKKFRLTREGEVLYDYSKQIIQTYDSLESKLQEIKDIISGTIRVATIYSIGLHDLPPYLKRFLKAFPTVNVHVEYRRSNDVYEDVLGNVVDVGLVAYPVRDPKLETVPLRKDPLVLICHPHHPLAKSKSAALKEINGQKFIAFEPDIPTRRAIDRILKDHGVSVSTAMEFDNIETVKRAVEIDAGIAIVPHSTIVQEVAKQTLAEVKLEDDEFFRPLAAIYKKNKVLSPAMKQFLAALKGEGKPDGKAESK